MGANEQRRIAVRVGAGAAIAGAVLGAVVNLAHGDLSILAAFLVVAIVDATGFSVWIGLLLVVAAVAQLARDETRWIRDVTLGIVGTILSTGVAAGAAMGVGTMIVRTHDAMGWGGAPAFRGVYTAVLALIALTISLAVWTLVRRWATLAGAHVGQATVAQLLGEQAAELLDAPGQLVAPEPQGQLGRVGRLAPLGLHRS